MSRFHGAIASAALAVLLGVFSPLALAGAAGPLEGSWGGADAQGRTAQVIIAGDSVIGVYWMNDYHDAANTRFSHGGARLDFEVVGRKATLVRSGADARITVKEPDGAVVSINLKRD